LPDATLTARQVERARTLVAAELRAHGNVLHVVVQKNDLQIQDVNVVVAGFERDTRETALAAADVNDIARPAEVDRLRSQQLPFATIAVAIPVAVTIPVAALRRRVAGGQT
jgi:hypothetical protein